MYCKTKASATIAAYAEIVNLKAQNCNPVLLLSGVQFSAINDGKRLNHLFFLYYT